MAAFVLLFVFQIIEQAKAQDYIGSAQCATCHEAEYNNWEKSHHSKSMMQPDEESVLGDFNDVNFAHQGTSSSFSTQNGKYYVTVNNTHKFEIVHTFGFFPLQQYLLDMGDGKYQAYDVAWDSRSEEEGGQRWFKLLPDEDTSEASPLNWKKHTLNWNSRCAECHSTNVSKNFDIDQLTYNTTFSEINVGCESCHGAGSAHQKAVESDQYDPIQYTGFTTSLFQSRSFVFQDEGKIASPDGQKTNAQINACGGCHSRRQVIGEINPAKDYHDQYNIRFLDQSLYFPDGQIEDEVFVLGSFLQSKMHQAGVTCTNCHAAHSGKVKAQDNSLCTQCHLVEAYDRPSHHKHPENSNGAACINCHMPATTYMQVDDRRDHSFSIPDPVNSIKLETPNACTKCHQDKSNQWASTALEKWPVGRRGVYAEVIEKSRKSDPLVLRNLAAIANEQMTSSIKRATALSLTGNIPSRLSAETILSQLKSNDPMLRRAAVEASQFISPQHRWTYFKDLLDDPSASVRYAVAEQLSGYLPMLLGKDYGDLLALLNEYETQLKQTEDLPSGQTTLAAYLMNRGKSDEALAALNKALEIEPAFVPAILNKADIYRAMSNEQKTQETLQHGLTVAPDSGAIQHAYGLLLIRQKQLSMAIKYLKEATKQVDSSSRFYYVYAVALATNKAPQEAIHVLEEANDLWPNQYDTLMALVIYTRSIGAIDKSRNYLSSLSQVAPNNPEVKKLINQFKN